MSAGPRLIRDRRRNDPDAVIGFMSCLRLVEGEKAGQLYEPMSWHREVTRGLFGPVDDEGFRIIREAYISVPRKNAKTTFCAALAIYFLFADGEQGAQIYCVASSVEQAKVCFRIIAGMVEQSDLLKSMCRIVRSYGLIEVPATNSRLKVLSRLAGQAHGLNPSFVIYDELHVAATGELYNALLTGQGSRRQPLMVAITTAGYDRKSVCFQKYSYAKKVLSGSIKDDSFFAYIKEPAPGDDWKDPKTWRKVNPGWNISVRPESLESLARQAETAASEENNFRRLYLNEWVSSSSRWLNMSEWDAGDVDAVIDDFADCEFYGGLDLSTTQDLTAFVLCCRRGDFMYLFPWFFLPSETIETHKINRAAYQGWQKSGDLIATVGNVIDYDYIVQLIRELGERIRINGIAYDAWNSSYPVSRLAEDFEMIRFPQSFPVMSPASKDFERALKSKKLLHVANPVLRWCADNVEIMSDRFGNIKPVAAAEDNKIDGIVAAIMAYDLTMKNSIDSVYETRGVLTL